MYLIKILNTTLKRQEIFYCSDSVNLTDFKEALHKVKHGYPRDWIRPKRTIISEFFNQSFNLRHEMKYVVIKNEDNVKSIFIFDKEINHGYFYKAIKFLNEELNSLVSAGFTNGISCYGRSESLDKDSDFEDIHLIV